MANEKVAWLTFIILFVLVLALVTINCDVDENTQKALIYSNQQTTNTLLYNPIMYK